MCASTTLVLLCLCSNKGTDIFDEIGHFVLGRGDATPDPGIRGTLAQANETA
jgi:hypothetical protein